jgi:hypothetical protein
MPTIVVSNSSEGGVEEKKEDEPVLSPTESATPHRQSPFLAGDNDPYDEQTDGFQAQVQNFANTVLGSCGNALSFLVPGSGSSCRWPGANDPEGEVRSPLAAATKAPLSITDELRKLAAKEGRVFGGGMRRADIPRFLGEEAVYSFEDDNISAISQNTLEEMTKHGIKYPVRRKPSSESSQNTPPPPTEKRSGESRGSGGQRKKERSVEHRDGMSKSKGKAAAPEL